jgi:hypothetical protein
MKPHARRMILMACVLGATALVLAVAISDADAPSPPPCCPQCGCHEGLIPVCHTYWTTKKETKYRYCCQCEPICIPEGSTCCRKLCGTTGDGADGSCCNDVGGASGHCNCSIFAQHKLVKFPYTVETPVCKCKIDWICPQCGCNCTCIADSDPVSNPDSSDPLSRDANLTTSSGLPEKSPSIIESAFEQVPGLSSAPSGHDTR